MALSSKRIQILVLAMILIACAATAFGQDYWSVQKPMSCHPKLLSSVHGGIFQPQVKQYEWQGRVTNTYDQTVTFDMYMKVGNQKKTIGRFTVEPGKSTNATSLYYDDSSKLIEISVDNVCFLKGGCKVSCYAGCDNGRSINQPSCDDDPKGPTSNQNQNSTNNTGTANNAEAIVQKIRENLKAGNGVDNLRVTVEGERLKIVFDLGANNYLNEYTELWNLRDIGQLEVRGAGNSTRFSNFLYSKGDGCKVHYSRGPDEVRPSCGVPYAVGPGQANLNELKALLAQLAGAPSSPQPSASNAEAIKQKLKQNLEENFRWGSGNSNGQVSVDANGVTITWDSMTTVGTIRTTYRLTFDKLAAAEAVNGQYPQLHFPPGNCVAKFVSNGSEAGCSDVPYSLGNNGQNFNELKALAAQLAGAPTSPEGNSLLDLKKRYIALLEAKKNQLNTAVRISLTSDGQFQVDYRDESGPVVCKLDFKSLWREASTFDNGKTFYLKWFKSEGERPFTYGIDQPCGGQVLGNFNFVSTPTIDEEFNLLRQIRSLSRTASSGGTAPAQNSSGGTNNSSGNSSTPTNSGSSSSGGKAGKSEALPKPAYDLSVNGVAQYNAKNYEAAVESFKKAIEIAPNSYSLNFNLGLSYTYLRNNYEGAAKAFQRVIEIEPTYAEAYRWLGLSLDSLNRKDEAIEWLKKGVRAVPDNARLWYNLGERMLASPKEEGGALGILQHSVELDPKCMDCQWRLGDAFMTVKEWDAAIRSYEAALQFDPHDGRLMPYPRLITAYVNAGKYAEAVALYKKLLTFPDRHPNYYEENTVHLQLGLAYCGLKDKPNAMAMLTKLKICPTCSSMYSEELLQKIQATWPAGPKKPRK